MERQDLRILISHNASNSYENIHGDQGVSRELLCILNSENGVSVTVIPSPLEASRFPVKKRVEVVVENIKYRNLRSIMAFFLENFGMLLSLSCTKLQNCLKQQCCLTQF